jgi:Lon protease-like protein
MDLLPHELPLFPLNLVLLPSCRVPLHIFEERYKLMINGCLERETEFAIVWGTDQAFREVGCAARVTDVINRFSDGRMNILIQGTRRIRVAERRDVHPFISGIVADLADSPPAVDRALSDRTRRLYEETLKLTLGWFRPGPAEAADPAALSYTVAASLNLPLERQQAILETRSADERLRAVCRMLEGALDGLREVTRRATGNGKAH